jgi:hypothetical protein
MEGIVLAQSYTMQFSEDGGLVYFLINVKELFNVSLSYPGIRSAIKKAFNESKQYIPVRTGLMKRSYTIDSVNNDTMIIYFDPAKIVGKTILGRVVKEYYPKYLSQTQARFNFLDIIMKNFYKVLISEVKQIKQQKDTENLLSMVAAMVFIQTMNDSFKKKIQNNKAQRSVT